MVLERPLWNNMSRIFLFTLTYYLSALKPLPGLVKLTMAFFTGPEKVGHPFIEHSFIGQMGAFRPIRT
jgi:hypothetical protein